MGGLNVAHEAQFESKLLPLAKGQSRVNVANRFVSGQAVSNRQEGTLRSIDLHVLTMESVRRADLDTGNPSSQSHSPDPELETHIREKLRQTYADFTDSQRGIQKATETRSPDGDATENQEDDYEFRLFSKPTHAEASATFDKGYQRIALRSPTPTATEPSFLIPRRPESFYFAGPTTSEQELQFRQAAVSGEDVLEGVKIRWRGFELPWRVTIIKSARPSKSPQSIDDAIPSNSSARKRNGKKRRIAIRKKLVAVSVREMAAQKDQAEREHAEREKRSKKNREKKLKRMQKEKVKRASETAQGT